MLTGHGIVAVVVATIDTRGSFSSLIPDIDTVATPPFIYAVILIGYFLGFLNLKSNDPYDTVASLPGSTYPAPYE